MGIFLENDFWTPPCPPPPNNFVHGSDWKCLNQPKPWPQRSAQKVS